MGKSKDIDHGQRAHALLSASGSKRWLNCTPSARLEEKYENKTSIYAEEGTLAHEFGDIELRNFNKELKPKKYQKLLDENRNHPRYTDEMEGQVAKYTDIIIELYNELFAKDKTTLLSVEERLDFSKWVKDGYGTGDANIVGAGELIIGDLKYGKGVRVDAEDNTQLMLYGLGGLKKYKKTHKIKSVRLLIIQPRLNHYSSFVISAKDLLAWGKSIKDKAQQAWDGEGELVAGDWCKFCKAKATCPALAEEGMKMAKYQFKDPMKLSKKEMLDIYEKAPKLIMWAAAVKEHMTNQILNGEKFKGFKVVEGRSQRKWSSDIKVKEALEKLGYESDEITNTKLKTVPQIQKILSVDEFNDSILKYVDKPKGKPTIVDKSDKRPDYDAKVTDVFKD